MTFKCLILVFLGLNIIAKFLIFAGITKLLMKILVELRGNDEKHEDNPVRRLKMVWKRAKAPTDRAKQWIVARERESRR